MRKLKCLAVLSMSIILAACGATNTTGKKADLSSGSDKQETSAQMQTTVRDTAAQTTKAQATTAAASTAAGKDADADSGDFLTLHWGDSYTTAKDMANKLENMGGKVVTDEKDSRLSVLTADKELVDMHFDGGKFITGGIIQIFPMENAENEVIQFNDARQKYVSQYGQPIEDNASAITADLLRNTDTFYSTQFNMNDRTTLAIALQRTDATNQKVIQFSQMKFSREFAAKGSEKEKPNSVQSTEAQKSAFEPVSLSTGKYMVGTDIPEGKYDIQGIQGGNFSVASEGKDYGDVVSEIIKNDQMVYKNLKLTDGETVMISNQGRVKLSAAATGKIDLNSVSAGDYIVGDNIAAGKYDLIGVAGGNISVCSEGKDYGDIMSEIIKAGEPTYANLELKDGYTVKITNAGIVKFTEK